MPFFFPDSSFQSYINARTISKPCKQLTYTVHTFKKSKYSHLENFSHIPFWYPVTKQTLIQIVIKLGFHTQTVFYLFGTHQAEEEFNKKLKIKCHCILKGLHLMIRKHICEVFFSVFFSFS